MIDVIARGMIEESNGDISQISEKVNNHTEDSDIHVTTTDKENWNSHPNDVLAAGNPIQMDNLQGGMPFSEIVVSGKNLYDNSIIVGMVGTQTGDILGGSTYLSTQNYINVEGNKTYVLSNAESKEFDTVVFYDSDKSFISSLPLNRTEPFISSFTTPTNCKYVRWRYNFAGTATVDMLTNIQLELGDTPTAYEPPITGRELQVNVCGKNLLNNEQTSAVSAGVTITKNSDGTVTLNGTSTADFWLLFTKKCPIVKDKTYTFSSGLNYKSGLVFAVRSEDSKDSYMQTRTYGSFVSPITGFCRIRAYAAKDATFNNLIIRPQLEIGSTATPYEPYHGSTTTITPDSNPYVLSNDIRQQEGYNVVSVSVGEISVTGVRKNAAIKRIWDNIGMDLLFDGITDESNPAMFDLTGYNVIEIHHIMVSTEKICPIVIRMSIDNYLATSSTIISPIYESSVSTVHNENGNISSLYAVSADGSAITNTKIYGIR